MSQSPLFQSWPPKRRRILDENAASLHYPTTSLPATPSMKRNPLLPFNSPISFNTPTNTLSTKKIRKNYRNGYESKPKTPSYKPFELNNPGHPRQKPFAFSEFHTLSAMAPLSSNSWNTLALSERVLTDGQSLRDYQIEAANYIILRRGDMCVIAPTGAGKSLLWVLPLLAQKNAISLVIIPYTSLGFQGEHRHAGTKIKCTFLHSGGCDKQILEDIARGGAMHIVYTCVEMLETPAVSQVLHSQSFQAQLSAVYVDEAHVVHESHSWRPSYARLYLLRTIIGTNIPLIAISATLPKPYRDSIQVFAGLLPDYYLINLGNFRPELSTIVARMQHSASSFLDLTFVLPWNSTINSICQTIIYSDDLELLTSMFWWFHSRLGSMGLPVDLVDILHAGLSEEHQKICTADFIKGKSKILLGSDKIGAGMDFPHVTLVVQYRCRGLTLVRWEQRRGRGGRRPGLSAVGVILVEKSMTGDNREDMKISSEDQGLIDLIQTENCQEDVVDLWLQNPPREKLPRCGRCSNCDPNHQLQSTFTWIMEDPQPRKERGSISNTEKKRILSGLIDWRQKIWEDEWRDKWPSYSPESLVSNVDLEEISRRAPTISTIDDIDSITHIPHLDELASSILDALDRILLDVIGEPSARHGNTDSAEIPVHEDPHIGQLSFTTIQWAAPENVETMNAENQRSYGPLSHGEVVLNFDQ